MVNALPDWLFGITIAFAGVCVIFYEHLADFIRPDFQFGIVLSVAATITWAFDTYCTPRKKPRVFNPYFSLGLQMLISNVCLFAFTGATGTNIPLTQIPAASWCEYSINVYKRRYKCCYS